MGGISQLLLSLQSSILILWAHFHHQLQTLNPLSSSSFCAWTAKLEGLLSPRAQIVVSYGMYGSPHAVMPVRLN